jgi:predicted RNase H-like nuclease (RuvC/YqgF family)
LEEALNNAGATNNGIISKDDAGMYGVRYNDLIAPMVKGMQEQQEMIEAQKAENEALRSRLDKMEALLKELAK